MSGVWLPPRSCDAIPSVGGGRSRCSPVERAVAAVLDRLTDGHHCEDEPRADRPGFVCPFCGRTFEERPRRCDRCDWHPVVSTENRRVYAAVMAHCRSPDWTHPRRGPPP